MFARILCTLLVASATVMASAESHAQSEAESRSLAIQLFDEAEALSSRGETAAACPKYAESYRLDPQLGALLHLADCYEKNGELASAWGSFRQADEVARKLADPRAELAEQRAKALEPRLTRLVIHVPRTARVSGLTVLRDGVPIAAALWGVPAAIDPGAHRIEARAPGRKPWRKEVATSGEGAVTEVTVPDLASLPAATAPERTSAAEPGSSRRMAALAVGGLGLLGVGVGGFFGLSAQSSSSAAEPLCNAGDYCTQQGHDLRNSAKTKANVATVVAGAGAAALVTAGFLWFSAPRKERAQSVKEETARSWGVVPMREMWGVGVHRAF